MKLSLMSIAILLPLLTGCGSDQSTDCSEALSAACPTKDPVCIMNHVQACTAGIPADGSGGLGGGAITEEEAQKLLTTISAAGNAVHVEVLQDATALGKGDSMTPDYEAMLGINWAGDDATFTGSIFNPEGGTATSSGTCDYGPQPDYSMKFSLAFNNWIYEEFTINGTLQLELSHEDQTKISYSYKGTLALEGPTETSVTVDASFSYDGDDISFSGTIGGNDFSSVAKVEP